MQHCYRDALAKFNDGDERGPDTVSFLQFSNYFEQSTEKLWQAFASLDDQKSGLITESSLLRSLRHLGMSAQPEDARRFASFPAHGTS